MLQDVAFTSQLWDTTTLKTVTAIGLGRPPVSIVTLPVDQVKGHLEVQLNHHLFLLLLLLLFFLELLLNPVANMMTIGTAMA